MKIELIKYSSPGWIKQFENEHDLIDELRNHICQSCRFQQDETYEYFNENGTIYVETDINPVVDVIHPDGTYYECRDIVTLLGTACGCEYGVDIDGMSYYEYKNI